MPNKQAANEWFEKGEEDLLAVETLIREQTTPNVVCFHCQQIAEKYLKGFLVYSERDFEKIHAISKLLESCMEIDPDFSDLKHEAASLLVFYVQTRYPGDFPQFTFADAQKALENARKIKEFVLRKININ